MSLSYELCNNIVNSNFQLSEEFETRLQLHGLEPSHLHNRWLRLNHQAMNLNLAENSKKTKFSTTFSAENFFCPVCSRDVSNLKVGGLLVKVES